MIGILIAGVSALIVPRLIYGKYIPNDSHSMPATLYIAMGMQGDAGWFNSYNTDTYIVVDANPIEANAWAKESICNQIEYFKNNPNNCLK